MAAYLTFLEMIQAVQRACSKGTEDVNLIKSMINMVYLNEVLECDDLKPLHWLTAPVLNKLHAPKTITGISIANPCVLTSSAHAFVGGEIISIWDVDGMEEINSDYVASWSNIKLYHITATGLAANTFAIQDLWGTAINSSTYTAYTENGTILHHGWKLVGGAADLIKSIPDVSIYDGIPLEEISWKELLESPDTYISSAYSTPTKYIHHQVTDKAGSLLNYLLTFPGNDIAQTAYIMAESAGTRLSGNTDTPLLPAQFHDVIPAGAIVRLAENNVQVENAVVWPGIYTAQLAALRSYNQKYYKKLNPEAKGKPYML